MRWLSVFVLLAAVGAALAACGDDDYGIDGPANARDLSAAGDFSTADLATSD